MTHLGSRIYPPRRNIRLLTGLLVVLCALHSYSCGSDRRARQPGEPVEVIVWDFGGVPGHREWIRGAVERFNSSRDDIRISLETRDWNTQRSSRPIVP